MTRLCATLIVAFATLAPAQDLTGIWKGNDGGTYRITQHGAQVFWYGRSADGGRAWQNVFHGSQLSREVISGTWADLPPGAMRNSGNLTLRIAGDRLFAQNQTGGFAGTDWLRGTDEGPVNVAVSPASVQRGIAALTPVSGGRTPSSYAAEVPPGPWASESAAVLERVIRRLAGDGAWNEYYALEAEKLKPVDDGARVQKRMSFINLILP